MTAVVRLWSAVLFRRSVVVYTGLYVFTCTVTLSGLNFDLEERVLKGNASLKFQSNNGFSFL